MKAIWNGETIAEAKDVEIVEGNVYFPEESVKMEFFRKSTSSSVCPWKGKASYYDVIVNGKTNKDAAWTYPEPKSKASNIKNFIAFWNGVEIKE